MNVVSVMQSRLQNEFAGNISALADAENISRKIIARVSTPPNCLNQLLLFSHPGELSARSGEMHFKSLYR